VCRHSHSMPEGQGVLSSQAGTQTLPECRVRHRPEGQSAPVRQEPASAAVQSATPVSLPEATPAPVGPSTPPEVGPVSGVPPEQAMNEASASSAMKDNPPCLFCMQK
jgi:hypothetical protein